MYNCHSDILAFHNNEVTLPQSEQSEMRERRDTNRASARRMALDATGSPRPRAFSHKDPTPITPWSSQPDKDYDIDDGTYFSRRRSQGAEGWGQDGT